MGTRKNRKVAIISFFGQLFNPVITGFLKILIVFLSFFTLYRLVLLLTNIQDFKGIPLSIILQSFLVGLRFDLSVSLYALSALYLVNYIFFFFNKRHWLKLFNLIYLTLIFFVFVFLSIVEIEFYKYFHSRLNVYVLNIEKNLEFVTKMIWESYPVIPLLLIILAISLVGILLFKKLIYSEKARGIPPLGLKIFSFAVFGILMFIGIRGTLSQKTPLRWGHAFFSTYNACNKLALNGIFTLVDDWIKNPKHEEEPEKIFTSVSPKTENILREILDDSISEFIHFPLRKYEFNSPPTKFNVVIFILESFGLNRIEEYTKRGVPLFFNRLKNQSVYFPNFYSNGIHTYMGVFSTLFGYPNLLGKNLMARNIGQQSFNGLPNILKENGYTGYFGVSHDPNFDNMAGFLRGNGVDHIVSQFDFPPNMVISTLGIPDHILFEKMNKVFSASPRPFFGIILSTNNHGPWVIPKVEGKSFVSTFDYTDWALEHFFELAKKENYFDSTVFIITADHGVVENPRYDLPLEGVRIPLLIYCPKILSPAVFETIGSQLDIPNTILSILRIPFFTKNFGKNILCNFGKQNKGFAIFHESQTLGIICNDWYLIDRLKSSVSLYKYCSDNPLKDYSEVYPDTARFLKEILEGIYCFTTRMVSERKISEICSSIANKQDRAQSKQ
mgnify:CR=1 FL=1